MSTPGIQRWRCPEKGTITLLFNLCQIRRDTAERLNRIAHPKPDGPEDIKTLNFCLTCTETLIPYDLLPSPAPPAASDPPPSHSAAEGQTPCTLSAPAPAPTPPLEPGAGPDNSDAPQPCATEDPESPLPASAAQGPSTAPQPGELEPEGLPLGSDSPGPIPCHICGVRLPSGVHNIEASFTLWDLQEQVEFYRPSWPLCTSPVCLAEAARLLKECWIEAMAIMGTPVTHMVAGREQIIE